MLDWRELFKVLFDFVNQSSWAMLPDLAPGYVPLDLHSPSPLSSLLPCSVSLGMLDTQSPLPTLSLSL